MLEVQGAKEDLTDQISQEPRRVGSYANHHHSIDIHLYQMTPNAKIWKVKIFGGVVGGSAWSKKIWAQFLKGHISKNIDETTVWVGLLIKFDLLLEDDRWYRKRKVFGIFDAVWLTQQAAWTRGREKFLSLCSQGWLNQIQLIMTQVVCLSSMRWYLGSVKLFENFQF